MALPGPGASDPAGMTRPSGGARWSPWAASVLAVAALLGPTLAPGVAIAYDMPWSPTPRLTPFALGIGTPAPRAVPGDAVITVLGLALGPGVAQVLVLAGLLLMAAGGVIRSLRALAPGAGSWAASAGAVAAIWNPFVLERLVIGQWVAVLGYAVLCWTLSWLLTSARGRSWVEDLRWPAALLTAASLGGANPWAMVAAVVGPAVLILRLRWRTVLGTIAVALGTAAVWALPALSAKVSGDPAGAGAFAPRSDTPFGVVVSLLSGGGFWNLASHPWERGSWFVAGGATLWALAASAVAVTSLWSRCPRALASFAPAVLLVVGSALGGDLWGSVMALPGGGILRDGQKFLAPWVVLLAVGAGLVAARAEALARRWPAALALGVAATLLPVALLPSGVWGIGGRLRAVEVPDGLRQGTAVLSEAPSGVVGILPWNQYRRYAWNGGRISLTVLPRMVDQVTLYDDSLPLAGRRIAGEDPRAAAVSAAIGAGVPPVDALVTAGVRYVALERRAGLSTEVPTGRGTVLVDNAELLVIDLGAPEVASVSMAPSLTRGWWVTLVTWMCSVLVVARPLRHKGAGGVGHLLRKR